MTQKTCKPCCDWSEPISQKLARFSESELAFWKACAYDHSRLGKPACFWKLASLLALWNTVSWLYKRAYQSSQSRVANVKAGLLSKLARFLVKWSPGPSLRISDSTRPPAYDFQRKSISKLFLKLLFEGYFLNTVVQWWYYFICTYRDRSHFVSGIWGKPLKKIWAGFSLNMNLVIIK